MRSSSRACPVCGLRNASVLLRFTPDMISALNPAYRQAVFKAALQGREHLLTYSRCQSCRMVYCENQWSEETLRKVYQDTIDHEKSRAKVFATEKKLTLAQEWEMILRLLAIDGREAVPDLKLIDFGCGWGDFLEAVSGPGVQCLGFETDSIKAECARGRGLSLVNRLDDLKAFAPADIFVMNAVIEHVQNVGEVLSLAAQLLAPRGLLVASTIDFRPAYLAANGASIEKNGKALTMYLNPVEHVNVYDYDSLMRTLDRYAFKLIATRTVMDLANFPIPFLRNSRKWIFCLSQMEKWMSKIDQHGEKSITVYARKR